MLSPKTQALIETVITIAIIVYLALCLGAAVVTIVGE